MELSESQTKALLFLDVCAKIEQLFAELYHFYSTVFSDDREVFLLWNKTAIEEENHLKQIQLAIKMRYEIDSLQVPEAFSRTYTVYQRLQQLVAGVKSKPPGLVVALQKSIEMEEHLASLHVDCSIRFKDDSLRRMFEALKNADQHHIAALQRQLSITTLKLTEMKG